jgi:uncharacterized membrane protein
MRTPEHDRPGATGGSDHWLEWKVRLFAIGAALAFGGMVLRIDWVVSVAIVVLLLGFLARFVPRGDGHDDAEGGQGSSAGLDRD